MELLAQNLWTEMPTQIYEVLLRMCEIENVAIMARTCSNLKVGIAYMLELWRGRKCKRWAELPDRVYATMALTMQPPQLIRWAMTGAKLSQSHRRKALQIASDILDSDQLGFLLAATMSFGTLANTDEYLPVYEDEASTFHGVFERRYYCNLHQELRMQAEDQMFSLVEFTMEDIANEDIDFVDVHDDYETLYGLTAQTSPTVIILSGSMLLSEPHITD